MTKMASMKTMPKALIEKFKLWLASRGQHESYQFGCGCSSCQELLNKFLETTSADRNNRDILS